MDLALGRVWKVWVLQLSYRGVWTDEPWSEPTVWWLRNYPCSDCRREQCSNVPLQLKSCPCGMTPWRGRRVSDSCAHCGEDFLHTSGKPRRSFLRRAQPCRGWNGMLIASAQCLAYSSADRYAQALSYSLSPTGQLDRAQCKVDTLASWSSARPSNWCKVGSSDWLGKLSQRTASLALLLQSHWRSMQSRLYLGMWAPLSFEGRAQLSCPSKAWLWAGCPGGNSKGQFRTRCQMDILGSLQLFASNMSNSLEHDL